MSRLHYALSLAILLSGIAHSASASGMQSVVVSETRRISMDVWQRPLREVAAQLARQGCVDILIPAAIGDLEVSASLVAVDARAALQRLLAHSSYMIIERDGQGSGGHDRRVIEVLIFGTNATNELAVTSAPVRIAAIEDPTIDELVQSAVMATSVGERATAVDALAYRDPMVGGPASRAESVLLSALSDSSEVVRAQAIATLKDTSDRIPFDALSQLAREDASADLRIQALELIVERSENGEAREPLGIALNDPDALVRERARELAEDWHLEPAR